MNNAVGATILIVLISTLFCGCSSVERSADPARAIEEPFRRIDDFLQDLADRHLFSGSVLIARGDEILYAGGFGESGLPGIGISVSTPFCIASVSKQFTAAAILIRQERGLLSLEDQLEVYFPKYFTGSGISLRHLLQHQSGLTDLSGELNHREGLSVHSPEEIISLISTLPREFLPESGFLYANSNYYLLAKIVQQVTGEDFMVFLERELFVPLNMRRSGIRSRFPDHAEGFSAASFFRYRRRRVDPVDVSVSLGAGGLSSSADDLFRWMRWLYSGDDPQGRMIGQGLIESPVVHDSGGWYGYGVAIRCKSFGGNSVTEIWHGGGMEGYTASVHYYSEPDISLIILSNYQAAPLPEIIRIIESWIFP
jgi:CubicO group peptidase (beta-lactamase class C family)